VVIVQRAAATGVVAVGTHRWRVKGRVIAVGEMVFCVWGGGFHWMTGSIRPCVVHLVVIWYFLELAHCCRCDDRRK
jgi:hypothetical protein